MALLIKVEDIGQGIISMSREEVQPQNPAEGFRLAELYALLDCQLVEVVHCHSREASGKILIIDEEGKLKGDPIMNPEATRLSGLWPHDAIFGSALLCEDGEFK
jgi:hypothetical protein